MNHVRFRAGCTKAKAMRAHLTQQRVGRLFRIRLCSSNGRSNSGRLSSLGTLALSNAKLPLYKAPPKLVAVHVCENGSIMLLAIMV